MELLSSQDLVAQVRSHADIQDSDFVSDDEITRFLDLAYRTLYDIIIDANQDLFVESLLFKGSNYPMQLPASFYKLRGLDVRYADYFVQAKRVGFMTRQHAQIDFIRPYNISGIIDDVTYSLRANELKLFSTRAQSEQSLILWYIPKPKKIEDGAELPSGWERYLIYSACRDCRVKEDSSTKDFERQMMRTRTDVEDFCMRRDWANNPVIQKTGDLDVSDRSYGWSLSDVISSRPGDVEQTLAPSLGRKTALPETLSDYRVMARHTAYMTDQVAYCGLEMPKGLQGRYGQWVLVHMFRDVGNLYMTQKANPQYSDLNAVFAALPATLNIDSNVYKDARVFFNKGKVCYDTNVAYNTEVVPTTPPTTVGCGPLLYDIDVSWSPTSDVSQLEAPAYVVDDTATLETTLPRVQDDSYLVIRFRSTQGSIRSIRFDSEFNQLTAFERQPIAHDEQGRRLDTFISKNRFRAERFSERQMTIEVG